MAEIHVERKGPSGWLWILAITAPIVCVWLIMAVSSPDDFNVATTRGVAVVPSAMPPETVRTSGIIAAPPPEVAAFLTFADAPVGSPVGPAHEYTADGIRRLTRALDAVIEVETLAGNPLRDRLAAWRAKADHIQVDRQAAEHANQVRDTFNGAADLLSAAQQDRWPKATHLRTKIEEMGKAAAAIDGSRPLLDQTQKVKAFFDRAGAALVAIPPGAHR